MKPSTSKKKRVLYIIFGMTTAAVIVIVAFIGAMFAVVGVNGYPIHASCTVEWQFGVSCHNASETIVKQIETWTSRAGCKDGGQKCLYTLLSHNDSLITAKHTTPVKGYKDDLTFKFTETGDDSCACKGHSTSETWYALLDFGTNYCNLHNLVIGSGLDKTTGYKEDTSDSKCTQYSGADCEKY